MKYVDAGYVVALSSLALYAGGLLVRRRRLERLVGRWFRSETRWSVPRPRGSRDRHLRGTARPRTTPAGSEAPGTPMAPRPRVRRRLVRPDPEPAAPSPGSTTTVGRRAAPRRCGGVLVGGGTGELAGLFRHGRPSARPSDHARDEYLPSGRGGRAQQRARHVRGNRLLALRRCAAPCQSITSDPRHLVRTGDSRRGRRPLRVRLGPHLLLGPDHGEALGELHRPVPEPGACPERIGPLAQRAPSILRW